VSSVSSRSSQWRWTFPLLQPSWFKACSFWFSQRFLCFGCIAVWSPPLRHYQGLLKLSQNLCKTHPIHFLVIWRSLAFLIVLWTFLKHGLSVYLLLRLECNLGLLLKILVCLGLLLYSWIAYFYAQLATMLKDPLEIQISSLNLPKFINSQWLMKSIFKFHLSLISILSSNYPYLISLELQEFLWTFRPNPHESVFQALFIAFCKNATQCSQVLQVHSCLYTLLYSCAKRLQILNIWLVLPSFCAFHP